MERSSSVGGAMIFKTLERYFTLAFQIIVQLVIARILSPSDYGIVAMMTVFISVANVFINNGFNMAVIQKKEITNSDYPTALTLNVLIGFFLYVTLYIFAPLISEFYNTPELITALRVLALMLPIGSVFSIQNAIATRLMQFRGIFICNILGSISSGILGVVMAYLGFGYWALICQQLSSIIITTIVLTYTASWKPQLGYNSTSAKEMFAFGSKLLAAGLIHQIYTQLNSLVIGKKYSSSELAFYTKGRMFPSYITTGVDSALQSVSLSVFSKKQDDRGAMHDMMTKILQANTFLTFPIIFFLFICADQIVIVLLTEKWLPAVTFIRLCCVTYLFNPISSVGGQAIAAVGRSDIRLKLEFVKKPIGILLLILFLSKGAVGIAIGAMLSELISFIIAVFIIKKIVGYDVVRFIRSISPAILISTAMGGLVYILKLNVFTEILLINLLIEIIFAGFFYLLISYLFKVNGLKLLLNQFVGRKRN